VLQAGIYLGTKIDSWRAGLLADDSATHSCKKSLMRKYRKWKFFGIILIIVFSTLWILKPTDEGGTYDTYFSSLNKTLKNSKINQPVILLDLDRVDANLNRMLSILKAPLRYRIVTKSLPSPELLSYIMQKSGTRNLMPFHLSHIRILAEKENGNIDMLPGKPFSIDEIKYFYRALPNTLRKKIFTSVQWLIDTEERLKEYNLFAQENHVRLRVNLEIDVGLHRGGARTNEELGKMLSVIAQSSGRLIFSGFMGYDGHVVYVPLYIGSKEAAIRSEFSKVMQRYSSFVEFGRKNYAQLFTGNLTFNGGGSTTYALFKKGMAVNDVSAGSSLVMPSTFDAFTLHEHTPALFIAAPVLKKIDGFAVPFIEASYPLVEWWNPNNAVTFYVSGGGWSEKILAPKGVFINTLTASPPNENMLPIQSMLNGSRKVLLSVGDFVFYHPLQGDAIMQFNTIHVFRGGKIVAFWKSFIPRE